MKFNNARHKSIIQTRPSNAAVVRRFDLAVAAGIVLIKSLYEELKETVFTHYTRISPAPRMTLNHRLLENDNTGSLMKTATVCRAKCICVIVLSVKEMAQSTRHLK